MCAYLYAVRGRPKDLRNSDSCSKQHHRMPTGPPSVTPLELQGTNWLTDVSERHPYSHPTGRQTAMAAYTNDTGDVVCAVVEKSTDKLIGGTSDEGFDFHCGPGGDFPTEPPFVRYAEVDTVEDRRCERYRSFSFTIPSATNRLGRAILCPSVATRNVGKASLNLVPRRDLEDLR